MKRYRHTLLRTVLPKAFTTVAAAVLVLGAGRSTDGAAVPQKAVPPAVVSATIAKITGQPRYEHSMWGLSVTDLKTGKTLLQQNHKHMFVPGSIFKTYSAASVLNAYGPDYRFRTPVYRQGTVHDGVLEGNLILVATGDFSFGLRERKDGTLAYNSIPEVDHNYADTGIPGGALVKGGDPLAGLEDLAAQVRAAGIREVHGNVAIDDRLFATYHNWPGGLISPMWINENVLDITVTPPTGPDTPVSVDWRPKTAAYRVESNIKVGKETSLEVKPAGEGVVRITGSISAASGPVLQIWQIPAPADFARTALIEALGRAGVKVGAAVTGPNPATVLPKEAAYSMGERVAEHVSSPLSEFVKVILKVSYNRGADLMVCLVAVKAGARDCPMGLTRELETITALGVSRDSTILFDGAGSDERDRTSPAAMTTFLCAVAGQPYGRVFREGLPVLGVDGTLATNQKGTSAGSSCTPSFSVTCRFSSLTNISRPSTMRGPSRPRFNRPFEDFGRICGGYG